MEREHVNELLYQALETELGGVAVYESAIRCAQNSDLKEEWQKYLEETRNHERIVRSVLEHLDLDPTTETPGRRIVRSKGESLVEAMEAALEGDPAAAQLVAAECVVEAETKDHQNWELIGRVAEQASGSLSRILQEAYDQVEDEEDQHLYHTMGWSRELWIDWLGMASVLPPPEEEKGVKTAIGAARAEQQREKML